MASDRNPHRVRGPYLTYQKIDPGLSHRFVSEAPPSTVSHRLWKENEFEEQRRQGGSVSGQEEDSRSQENMDVISLPPDSDGELDLNDFAEGSSGTEISACEESSEDDADGPDCGEGAESPSGPGFPYANDGANFGGGAEGQVGDAAGAEPVCSAGFPYEEREEDGTGDEDFRNILHSAIAKKPLCFKRCLAYKVLKVYVKTGCKQSTLEGFLNIMNDLIENPDNRLPTKATNFLNLVDRMIPPCAIARRYFCYDCYLVLAPEGAEKCSRCGKGKSDLTHFFHFDVGHQIKFLLEKDIITGELRPDLLLDGSEFQRVKAVLRGKYDLTLILNSDGVRLVKSKKNDCWPILVAIAELPEGLRDRCLMFGGLWFGKRKPIMNVFMEPFVDGMIPLFERGVRWIHPSTGKPETTRAAIPLVVADSPGRSDLLVFSQHMGTYGCQICEVQSRAIYDEQGYLLGGRTYPYQETYRLRTPEKIHEKASQAERIQGHIRIDRRKKNCEGVKGWSVLSKLPLINLARAFPSELMHAVWLGSFFQLFEDWFFGIGPSSISRFKTQIERLMSAVKPPSFVHRLPRSIDELRYYKASELLFWFLFYVIPVLSIYLPPVYFKHFLLYAKGIYLLMKPDAVQHVRESERYLDKFLSQVESLYGCSFLTYNMHQVAHFPLAARWFGSLARVWAFPYEGFNGTIAESFHGTKNQGIEICNRISLMQRLLPLESMMAKDEEDLRRNSRFRDGRQVPAFRITQQHQMEMIRRQGLSPSVFYEKINIDGKTFTSKIYQDVKNNDFTVEIQLDGRSVLGEIDFFFLSDDKLFFFFSRFQCINGVFQNQEENLIIDYVLSVADRNAENLLLNLEQVKSLRHIVPVHNFVVLPPCSLYKTM